MDNLNDIRSVWRTAKTDNLPAAEEMLRMVKGFRDGKLRAKWKGIGLSAGTIVFWGVIMWFLNPVMLTTWIGAGLTVLSSVVLIWTNARSMKRFYALNDCSNREFLMFLEQTRRNQLYYHTKTQVLGLTLSTAGVFLYLYEFVHFSTIAFVTSYAVMAFMMLFTWVYIRPRSYRKQSAKLNATIEKLEKIANQIKNEDE